MPKESRISVNKEGSRFVFCCLNPTSKKTGEEGVRNLVEEELRMEDN